MASTTGHGMDAGDSESNEGEEAGKLHSEEFFGGYETD
jgi:hypothetical protein